MDIKPFISIITVCYNSERYIKETIESIYQQDFTDYEYIIVDGKSADRTMEFVLEYKPKFAGRMRWISEPDKGIYDAMNKGIQMSKGKLIWLVNSDDFINKGALQAIHDTYLNYNEAEWPIISFAHNQVTEDGNIRAYYFYDEIYSNYRFKRDMQGVLHPATIVPRKVYERHGLFDTNYKVIADTDWFHRMVVSGERIDFVEKNITNMRDGGASAVHNYKDRINEHRYFCRKNYTWPKSTLHFLRLAIRCYYGHYILLMRFSHPVIYDKVKKIIKK